MKQRLLDALHSGRFLHVYRRDRLEKNLLDVGVVDAKYVANIVTRSRGGEYTCSPHHHDVSIDVHVLSCSGWYIKFVVGDDYVEFLSVHRSVES